MAARGLIQTSALAALQPAHVDAFMAGAMQAYFALGEVVLEPSHGPVTCLMFVRQGSVSGRRG